MTNSDILSDILSLVDGPFHCPLCTVTKVRHTAMQEHLDDEHTFELEQRASDPADAVALGLRAVGFKVSARKGW